MNNYKAHQELIERAKLLAQKEIPKLRIFDRTVGLFYAKRINGGVINYTPVHVGKKGSADLILKYPGKYSMIVMDAEAKTGQGEQAPEQIIWENFIRSMNGYYFVFHTEQEFVTKVQNYLSYLFDKGLI